MELNVPTIAQRKAARRNQTLSADSNSLENQIASTPNQQASLSLDANQMNNVSISAPTEKKVTTPPEYALDKDKLIALARSMGLELAAPKKIWIKHSYSVTPESKEKFSKYCEVLGFKMQDGLEEALQDWFKKKEAEFKAVEEAKQP